MLTLYTVLQEFGARLLALLSKGNQRQGFIEGHLTEKTISMIYLLCYLEIESV